MILRSNDKHRTDALYSIQSSKVIVAFVKDIERIRLVRYIIHCIHVMKFRFSNVNVSRYLSDHIKQGMDLDSALGFAEVCPLEQTHAEIYRRRIERVELAIENERLCDSLALGKVDHMVGKLQNQENITYKGYLALLYFQIPQKCIDLNPRLKQNLGYK